MFALLHHRLFVRCLALVKYGPQLLDVRMKASQRNGHRSHEIVLIVIDQSLTIVQFRQRAQEHRQLVSFVDLLTMHDIGAELGEPYRSDHDAYESAHYGPVRYDSHHFSNFSLHINQLSKYAQ
ncbi:hypothetical protein DF153_11270 [Burkholderia cenocepacia]|nr:hypothetical protein DF152_01740 [Burkholderia cenocepacia]RQU25346.1 hypothetical protein DF153_11270 [Burkholderia cenocepacia]